MGLLKSFTASAGNTSTDVRLDRDGHTVLVRRRYGYSLAGKLRSKCPEIVSATIRDHTGTTTDVIKQVTLGDLAAYAQYGNGPILEVGALDAGSVASAQAATLFASTSVDGEALFDAAGQYISLLPIRLTADGKCVSITPSDDFVIKFEALLEDAVYDFFILEGQQTGTNMLRYQNTQMLEGQRELKLDVDNVTGIVMPATGSFNRLLLTFGNERVAKYTVDELKFESAQANLEETRSTVYAFSTTGVPGQGSGAGVYITTIQHDPLTSELLVMPLHDLTKVELDTDGSALKFMMVYNRSRLVTYA